MKKRYIIFCGVGIFSAAVLFYKGTTIMRDMGNEWTYARGSVDMQGKETQKPKTGNGGEVLRGQYTKKGKQELQKKLQEEKYYEELSKLLKKDTRLWKIIEERKKYPDKLIETLIKYPETADFVLHYPERRKREYEINLEEEVEPGKLPLFIQWDKRWGYDSYGDSMIGIAGCGPTCLAMVLTGLTGNTFYHPQNVAEYSEENGYWVQGTGTSWELMGEGAASLGLNVYRVLLQSDTLENELLAGRYIICSMKPGDFTYTGHFIVLAGLTPDGKVIVHDPNSIVRSGKKWRMDRLVSQMKAAWSYGAEGYLQ